MTFDSPESPSHRSAPVAEDRTLRSTRRSLRIFSLLLSGVLLLVVLMVLAIAQRQNRDATDHDRQRLRQAWDARQETMLTDVRDYAFWSEAWRNLHQTLNKRWAWDEENIGPDLYNEYHYEGVFVVDNAGRTRYAVINGKLADLPLEAWLGAHSASLLRDARGLPNAALARNAVPGFIVHVGVNLIARIACRLRNASMTAVQFRARLLQQRLRLTARRVHLIFCFAAVRFQQRFQRISEIVHILVNINVIVFSGSIKHFFAPFDFKRNTECRRCADKRIGTSGV